MGVWDRWRDVLSHNDFQAERYPAVREWGQILPKIIMAIFYKLSTKILKNDAKSDCQDSTKLD